MARLSMDRRSRLRLTKRGLPEQRRCPDFDRCRDEAEARGSSGEERSQISALRVAEDLGLTYLDESNGCVMSIEESIGGTDLFRWGRL